MSTHIPLEILQFSEHLYSWFSCNFEIHENWYPRNIHEFTVYEMSLGHFQRKEFKTNKSVNFIFLTKISQCNKYIECCELCAINDNMTIVTSIATKWFSKLKISQK